MLFMMLYDGRHTKLFQKRLLLMLSCSGACDRSGLSPRSTTYPHNWKSVMQHPHFGDAKNRLPYGHVLLHLARYGCCSVIRSEKARVVPRKSLWVRAPTSLRFWWCVYKYRLHGKADLLIQGLAPSPSSRPPFRTQCCFFRITYMLQQPAPYPQIMFDPACFL